jgi:hypothetical protein
MVLLNRLLVDCRLGPVLLNRTDIFGGAYTADELVAEIRKGLDAFQARVAAAHPPAKKAPEKSAEKPPDTPPKVVLPPEASATPESAAKVLATLSTGPPSGGASASVSRTD